VKARTDPFNAAEIDRILSEHRVDSVLVEDWTLNLELMPGVLDDVNYVRRDLLEYREENGGASTFGTLAYVSHRDPLTEARFVALKDWINGSPGVQTGRHPKLNTNLSDYRVIYSKGLTSDVEIDFSKRTRNGSNNLYVYVLEPK
jgi:hypothetical protein